MSEHRTVTYPAAMVEKVADELCDIDPCMPPEDAQEFALNIVLDVTLAVDNLRASEAQSG